MNNLINPFHPLQPTVGIYSLMDGGNMDGRWRSVGDDDGNDLLQFPIPAGCQNGVADPPEERSRWRRSSVRVSWKVLIPRRF